MSAVASPAEFPVTTLRILPCGETNLKCFYDRPLGRDKEITGENMPLVGQDYNRIVRAAAAAGINRILIGGGGEPLLRKDLPSVIKAICSPKKVKDIRFITNGVFLKDSADALKRAGLRHIELNFDSLNFLVYQKITRKDGLYRVLDGLEKLERMDFPRVICNIILFSGVNHREIVNFAIRTKQETSELRFFEYLPKYDNSRMAKQLHFPVRHAKKIIHNFQPLVPVDGGQGYRFKDGKGTLRFLSYNTGFAGYPEPQIVLNAEGVLNSDLPGVRSIQVQKELVKDNYDERLVKVFQKLMSPKTQKETTTRKKRQAGLRRAEATA